MSNVIMILVFAFAWLLIGLLTLTGIVLSDSKSGIYSDVDDYMRRGCAWWVGICIILMGPFSTLICLIVWICKCIGRLIEWYITKITKNWRRKNNG